MSPLDETFAMIRDQYRDNGECAQALAASMERHPASGPTADATVHNLDDYRGQSGRPGDLG